MQRSPESARSAGLEVGPAASTRRGCPDPRRHGTKRSTRQLLTIDGRSGSTDMRDATMLSLARTAVERVKESGRCPPPKPTA